MVCAILIGLVIGTVYMIICKKEGYQKNFIISLVVLPVIVCVVIMLIGSNVARAFSMAGAFALVRFRSAPGSGKDIAVVFFSMAAGLACGLGYISFAIAFSVIIILLFVLLSVVKFGEKTENYKQLRITIPENLNYSHVFDEIFDQYTKECKLTKVKTTNMGSMYELTYKVKMKDEDSEKEFIDDIRVKNGNLNIILGLMPAGNSEMLN